MSAGHMSYLRFCHALATEHDKTYKMACVPSEDSDQPGHPSVLISLLWPHEESLGPSLPIEHTTNKDSDQTWLI